MWGEQHQGAFEKHKRELCEAPVLQVPDFSRELFQARTLVKSLCPRSCNKE